MMTLPGVSCEQWKQGRQMVMWKGASFLIAKSCLFKLFFNYFLDIEWSATGYKVMVVVGGGIYQCSQVEFT